MGAAARPGTGDREFLARGGLAHLAPPERVRVLVTGAGGQLGRDVVRVLSGHEPPGGTFRGWWDGPAGSDGGSRRTGVEAIPATHGDLPVDDRERVLEAFETLRPHVVIHTAAFTAVDTCESEIERAFAVNALGTRHVAESAERYGAHLLYVSTDYVFDGSKKTPYCEWDQPHPLSIYGASKRGGEMECPPGATLVRTSWVCSVEGASMLQTVLGLARDGQPMHFVNDQHGCPTFTADLAKATAALALDRRPGTFHVTNQGTTTWYGFARKVLEVAGFDPKLVQSITTADLDPPRPAPRPANSVLDNLALRLGNLPLLPEWTDALERAVAACGATAAAPATSGKG